MTPRSAVRPQIGRARLAWRALVLATVVALGAGTSRAEPQPLPVPSECLVLRFEGPFRRPTAGADPLYAQMVAGTWAAPAAGDTLIFPDGTRATWERCLADENGTFAASTTSYMAVESPEERVALLEASGDGLALVNGEFHAGDPYGYGWLRVPVLLRAGTNDLVFAGGRGGLTVRLYAPGAPALLDVRDATLPDLVAGEEAAMEGAVVVTNATRETVTGLRIGARVEDSEAEPSVVEVPPLAPLTTRKVGFPIETQAIAAPGEVALTVRLLDADGAQLAREKLRLRVRDPRQTRKITFRSRIDGSVQYYALNPAAGAARAGKALVLTCHGASVEAIGQADAYAAKSWADLVAPTNRRPYGFDWEDWGRLDALEVLELATESLRPDPARVYLTGHSMGGHGSWHLGVTYPERFACVGPSAGWVSLWGRGRREGEPAPSPVEELFRRATRPSDTRGLAANLVNNGVYVLHGDADDNVPVTEARSMRDLLAPWHKDFQYHEEPGQGHWWSNTDEPGAACVDWAPLFQFFSRHRIPAHEEARDVEFVTMSPTVSDTCYWVRIEGQRTQFAPSSVKLRWDPILARVTGTTENVSRLRIALPGLQPAATVRVALDGTELAIETDPTYDGAFWLAAGPEGWTATVPLPPGAKRPERGGPFRAAFANRMVFVYGTGGTPEENGWALARARYDAEAFYYRGNGSVDLIADTAFDAEATRDRNVILYGNRDTNRAWGAVLHPDEPVSVGRGAVRVGEREVTGDNLGLLLVRPRVDSLVAQVAVVGGTGVRGMRASDRLSYLQSGVAYPDFVVLSDQVLERGVEGVLGAGFFGENWDLETAEMAWRE